LLSDTGHGIHLYSIKIDYLKFFLGCRFFVSFWLEKIGGKEQG